MPVNQHKNNAKRIENDYVKKERTLAELEKELKELKDEKNNLRKQLAKDKKTFFEKALKSSSDLPWTNKSEVKSSSAEVKSSTPPAKNFLRKHSSNLAWCHSNKSKSNSAPQVTREKYKSVADRDAEYKNNLRRYPG